MKRKLTTILCADAARYSSMMGSDEAATLERLRRHKSIMANLFDRHDGRQVNTWGDAVIAEFSSVVEAVRCAVEIQDSLSAENRSLPENRQMWMRIGINLGDVMIDEGDLYGDGVNVAARLESLAEPGGIVVSETVHALAHKQLAIGFDFIGEQKVKNIDEAIPSYKVRTGGRNQPDDEPQEEADDPSPLPPNSEFDRRARQMETGWNWALKQPRRIQYGMGAIAVFFGLNLLFGGIANPWFLFPSAPIALYLYLHLRAHKSR